jgi:hypothetical protein
MPKVSVVSLFYNRAKVAARTVDGIRAQTFADFDAYIINDGSTDETQSILSVYDSPQLHIIKRPNGGFTNTLIWAIAQADCDYIALNGSGDYSHPHRIARQVAFLDAHPEVAAASCYCNIISEVEPGRRQVRHVDVGADALFDLHHDRNPVFHGSAMIRRSAYDAVGGYRSFFTYRQDLDLWLRLAEDWRLANVPEILYDCYQLADSVSESVPRLIEAMSCGDFALYCSRERLSGRPDPLTKCGPVAALLRPRSTALARGYAYTGLRYLCRGQNAKAKLLLRHSLREKPLLRAALLYLFSGVSGLKPMGYFCIRLRDRWKLWLAQRKLSPRTS